MKHLKRFNESRVHDLEKVKQQFFDFLNGPLKKHWIKFNELNYACHQAFCRTYGYKFDDLQERNDKGDIINRKTFKPEDYKFLDKHKGLFTPDTLRRWFKEWREYALISWGDKKDENPNDRKKLANAKFPYLESVDENIEILNELMADVKDLDYITSVSVAKLPEYANIKYGGDKYKNLYEIRINGSFYVDRRKMLTEVRDLMNLKRFRSYGFLIINEEKESLNFVNLVVADASNLFIPG